MPLRGSCCVPGSFDVRHHMRRLVAYSVMALASGFAALAAAAFLGAVATFATPFFAGFPAPDPPDSTDFGQGMLMAFVGFCVFAVALVPLWIVCFKYFWSKFGVDSFIADGITGIVRDA
jgi:hypothetical protein